MGLIINEELRKTIPPLSAEERNALEASILKEGLRDPILVWGEIIVDGLNRYEICTYHGIELKVMRRDFDSIDDAKVWMIDNQLARRNLTDGQKYELVSHKKEILLEKGRQKMLKAGAVGGSKTIKDFHAQSNKGLSQGDKPLIQPEVAPAHNTRNEIAKELNWSTGKVAQADKVFKSADEETKQKVISGEVSIRKAYEQVKQEEAKAESEPVQPSDNGGASDAEKPKTANVHVANNSGENEWYTPEKHLELARNIMGSIDTDPASCELANRTVKAKTFFSIEDDGLQKQWYGNVWLNPPYANSLVGSFCEKLIDEIKAGRVKQAMLLVNNATETKWFQSSAKTADAICFLRGRVKYISPNGKNNSPLQGQAIIYFGENVSRFCEMFSGSGLVLCTCKKQ